MDSGAGDLYDDVIGESENSSLENSAEMANAADPSPSVCEGERFDTAGGKEDFSAHQDEDMKPSITSDVSCGQQAIAPCGDLEDMEDQKRRQDQSESGKSSRNEADEKPFDNEANDHIPGDGGADVKPDVSKPDSLVVEESLEDRVKSDMSDEIKMMWEDILADSELTTGDEMDLTKVYQPLAYYMTDHEELLNQLFATVKGALLASVMPAVLKEMDSDVVRDLFLKELKTMDLSELRSILRGGDFIVTPDLLPANPYRPPGEQPLVNGEEMPEELLVNGKLVGDDKGGDGDDFKPCSKKEGDENEFNNAVSSGIDSPKAEAESCFTGLGDDEKRRLEEALAALDAKEAEQPVDDDEDMDPVKRKAAVEAAMRASIDSLSQRLDELDGDAERLQAEGFQEMLEAHLEDATSQLDTLEKNLTETQEEINRLRSNMQAQIDAGVRLMNLNPKFVLFMKEVQELIARGRTLNRLLSPMRAEADRAMSKKHDTSSGPAESEINQLQQPPPSRFQPMSSFVPVSEAPAQEKDKDQRQAISEVFDTGDNEGQRLTWSARWVSSEKVQKVLTHSKVFSRVRQKMGGMRQRFAADQAETLQDSGTGSGQSGQSQEQRHQEPEVIKSVDEYRKFFRTMDQPLGGGGFGGNLPSFDTTKLSSLADQVKQAIEGGISKERDAPPIPGVGAPPPLPVPPVHGSPAPWQPPPGHDPNHPYYYPHGAPPMRPPPGVDPTRPPPPFAPGMPPPFPPPGVRPPFMDAPPPWMPPPPAVSSSAPTSSVQTTMTLAGTTQAPPLAGWDSAPPIFNQPPPAAQPTAQLLPWQQQSSMPQQWPPVEYGQPQPARHWPPLRPEDYQQQEQPQYGQDYYQQPTAATMLGSPLSTSDEEERKKKKKHKKEKKKRKKEKKEKKKKKKAQSSDSEEEGTAGQTTWPSAAYAQPLPSGATGEDDGEDEDGEIRDDEDNLWAKIMGDGA